MSYVVTEMPDGRSGSRDEKGVRHFTRVFRVISSLINDGPGNVASAVGIANYAPYITAVESDIRCILKNKSATPLAGEPFRWDVTCTYDSAPIDWGAQGGASPGQGSAPGQQANDVAPTARPWTIKLGSTKKMRPFITDQNNVVVCNSAYIPFDPPIEVEVSYPTITLTAFVASFAFSQQTKFVNSVNAATFQGYAAKRLRCTEYNATSQYENGQFFWQLEITFEFNPERDWNPLLVQDMGCSEKGGGGAGAALTIPIYTSTGAEVVPPGVPLDGSGKALKIGGVIQYKSFAAYRETDFSLLIV